MLVKKEIRIVALLYNLPDGVDAHGYLEGIALRREPCVISFDRACKQDAACMKGSIGHRKIGVVAMEDKKYVMPLLDKSATHTCTAEFMELYWDKDWAPILRYRIFVDLEDVKKELPGEYWSEWSYKGLAKVSVEEWNVLYESIDYLRGVLTGSIPEDDNLDDVIKEISCMCHYNISVDATVAIEDLCFLLEMNHDERSDRWKNKLQRASTGRRSKKTIMRFADKWWPEFLHGDASVSLIHTFLMRLKAKYRIKEMDNCKEQFRLERDMIEDALQSLPYSLYDYVEEPAELFYVAFYKKIPHDKMVDLFSAIILRWWMAQIMETKVDNFGTLLIPNVIKEINVYGTLNDVHDNKIYSEKTNE